MYQNTKKTAANIRSAIDTRIDKWHFQRHFLVVRFYSLRIATTSHFSTIYISVIIKYRNHQYFTNLLISSSDIVNLIPWIGWIDDITNPRLKGAIGCDSIKRRQVTASRFGKFDGRWRLRLMKFGFSGCTLGDSYFTSARVVYALKSTKFLRLNNGNRKSQWLMND